VTSRTILFEELFTSRKVLSINAKGHQQHGTEEKWNDFRFKTQRESVLHDR